ncbi:hypothetical protein [Simkania sp.]|uniref:hypothetical protein n=1 Tax=Simkania sp. TaxID=34094 RepID=UPI003B527F79
MSAINSHNPEWDRICSNFSYSLTTRDSALKEAYHEELDQIRNLFKNQVILSQSEWNQICDGYSFNLPKFGSKEIEAMQQGPGVVALQQKPLKLERSYFKVVAESTHTFAVFVFSGQSFHIYFFRDEKPTFFISVTNINYLVPFVGQLDKLSERPDDNFYQFEHAINDSIYGIPSNKGTASNKRPISSQQQKSESDPPPQRAPHRDQENERVNASTEELRCLYWNASSFI